MDILEENFKWHLEAFASELMLTLKKWKMVYFVKE